MTNEFRIYDINELDELAKSAKPVTVNLMLDEQTVDFLLGIRLEGRGLNDNTVDRLAENIEDVVLQTVGTIRVHDEQLIDGLHRLAAILDQGTVDFLLGLNTNNRTLTQRVVDSLVASITGIGWKSTESLCVTVDGQLGNGQHRLTALKRLGYPDGVFVTVVFGADKDSVLVIDQHSKRTATASIKMSLGKTCSCSMLSAIRHDILINAEAMTMSSGIVQPAELQAKLAEWERYAEEMPMLFHTQKIGTKSISLTGAMVAAVVHYRQRAGVAKANDFLLGFWGDRDRAATSPERKAMNYRLTARVTRGEIGSRSAYRTFAWLLVAHYEGRKNPVIREASDWAMLQNKQEA